MRFNPEHGTSEYFGIANEQNSFERLENVTRSISEKQNHELEQTFGLGGLLDAECRISRHGYKEIYSEDELQQFESELTKIENKFQHHSVDSDLPKPEWREQKSHTKGNQTELAITCLLYKMLGDKYLVARTNEFDDYTNSADNLLVDRETGAAICAFDEVYDRDDVGHNTEKKQQKVLEIAVAGGTDINFGIISEQGVLKRGKQESLPIFYLGLNREELEQLLQVMSDDLEHISDFEKSLYSKLIHSIAEQFVVLKRQELPEAVSQNLEKFRKSFSKRVILK